jgi:hypothetical protein
MHGKRLGALGYPLVVVGTDPADVTFSTTFWTCFLEPKREKALHRCGCSQEARLLLDHPFLTGGSGVLAVLHSEMFSSAKLSHNFLV